MPDFDSRSMEGHGWSGRDRRKFARFIRRNGGSGRDALYIAYCEGQAVGMGISKKRNHYPPGKRHDEFERGVRVGREGYHYPNHLLGGS